MLGLRRRARRIRRSFDDRRIFCIGLNKTGTTSLHQAFTQLGYASSHSVDWARLSFVADAKPFYHRAYCFSDGGPCHYVNLERWFPRSLFILNLRNERDWLRSRTKHVLAELSRSEKRTGAQGIEALGPGRFSSVDFLRHPDLAIDTWIASRRLYHDRVRRHFEGRTGFLELDVPGDPVWAERLETFLLENGEPVQRGRLAEGIHANRRDGPEELDADRLAASFELVDRRLAAYPDPVAAAAE